MSGDKHDLVHEFPEFQSAIHDLKLSNAHFAKLLQQHDDVDHEIRSSETGVAPHCDEHLVALKVKRLSLKDELHSLLKAATVTA